MTSINVDKKVLEELASYKLRFITEQINQILSKWGAPSIEDFLNGARDGTYEEAEGDAIDMTNLVDKREELYRLKAEWSSN
ncbi:MAG TPA: hypothetical protein VKK79_08205 [Candidatus Lokiarchaeia archaeon]|nr:hypothetical protein [Candidatus Lokiarchaeia archaeon]